MKWFMNFKISVKLLTGFILVALIAGIMGFIGITNLKNIDAKYSDLYDVYGTPQGQIGQAAMYFQRVRVGLRDEIIATDTASVEAAVKKLDESLVKTNEYLDLFEKSLRSDVVKADFKSLKDELASFVQLKDKVGSLARGQQDDLAVAALNGGAQMVTNIENGITKLQETKMTQGGQLSDELSKTADMTVLTMIGILAGAMIIAIILGIFLARIISRPIAKLVTVADKLAVGDVNVSVMADTKDEVGALMSSFERMVANIKVQAAAAEKIAAGDLELVINPKSENDILSLSMKTMIETLQKLVEESDMLTRAAVEGKLDTRGNAAAFRGGYSRIVAGVNQTLDAIIEPVNEASDVLKEMANKNLTVRVEGDYKGDHAEIKNALNNTLEALSEVLNDMNDAAEQVAAGSSQVSDGSQALSQGATEQASSIEELTSSITQVAAQTKQNAVNANQANELAVKAKENAEQGNNHMKEMLKSMQEINESSSNISKIIKVIDEIAFQTNILALNAAVEAARAGQHGKGFAVVAEEVRNLAARSANAAKETTDLIEGSIKKVESGTSIAYGTAQALGEIVTGVTKAADIVGDIAVASNEQATAIAQINKGIEQIAQVVQTNSATSEESASASEELSSQAAMLKQLVNQFTLKKGHGTYYREIREDIKPVNQLESGMKKKQVQKDSGSGGGKARILLSDTEFGKY